VGQAVAQAVNIDGTARVLAFARRCPRLERLAVLSTLYACGLQSGRVAEAPFGAASGFANFYEWSKWEAERHVLRDAADLPWRLLRIATVIADDDTGAVTQRNAFHRTLQLFYHGLLSLLPGDPATPLYFVTGDFVADAVYALTETTDARGIYHLAHDRGAACTLGELVATAVAIFDGDADFRRRRILPPLLCDWESFGALAEAVEGFSSPEVKHAVRSVAPFARQLFSIKDVDNHRVVARYAAYRAPEARALIAAVCTALLRARWRHASSGTTRADAA
jgi:nucleoside-diphosphate-sugar epimerase